MKKYQIEIKGKQIEIIQDDDGKFIKPEYVKEQEQFGTTLKPAYEPIIVARKPFKGSLVDNIEKNRVGGLNIDECRVEYGNETDKRIGTDAVNTSKCGFWSKDKNNGTTQMYKDNGRFPANVILTYDETDFEEVCGGFPNTNPSKQVIGGANRKSQTQEGTINPCGWKETNRVKKTEGYNDEGSASRYFYCAKASKKDRDEGLDLFEEKQTTDGCIRANNETARKFGANSALRKNIHPTVKPTSLMQYLVRLVTPKEGTILDPFMGSGSTGKSVMYENLERNANYKFIGIELTDEYLPIAKARIDYANKKIEESKFGQMKMFLD